MDTSINVTIILMASTQGLVPIGYISWCPNEHFCPTYLTKEKYELEENLKILWFILSSKNETQKGMGQQTQGHTVSSETKIDSNSSHLTLRPCSFLCSILCCPRLTQTHVKLWPGPWKISLLYLYFSLHCSSWLLAVQSEYTSFRHTYRGRNYHGFARRHPWTSDPSLNNKS